MRVVLLAGGTGGAKLAHGFSQVLPAGDLSVVVNVADDLELHGLHVSPDIDALLYTLGGLIDAERGWGLRDDTFTALEMFGRLGAPTWFRIGDGDLATHVERTRRLQSGETLTAATAALSLALGIEARVLPATDDHLRTFIETDDGEIDFQTYFVGRRQEPEVRGLRFDGIESARPTRPVLDAIRDAELIVIGPSNPLVSIGPILAIPGMREAVLDARAAGVASVAVSPIVAGHALKGPAGRMLVSLGHESSALSVAGLYRGVVGTFVLDEADAELAPAVAQLGFEVQALSTVMRTDAERAALAQALVEGRILSP